MMREEKRIRYGINMRKYCAAHTAYAEKLLSEGDRLDALLRLHDTKLRWLQHERLIHLIVTFVISILLLFSIWLFVALANPLVLILTATVLGLLAAYIRHYFFLENTVQRWYTLYDRIYSHAGSD
jgi:uncharacterized membrane-anchored protein